MHWNALKCPVVLIQSSRSFEYSRIKKARAKGEKNVALKLWCTWVFICNWIKKRRKPRANKVTLKLWRVREADKPLNLSPFPLTNTHNVGRSFQAFKADLLEGCACKMSTLVTMPTNYLVPALNRRIDSTPDRFQEGNPLDPHQKQPFPSG
jgi:hypothetical protein